MFFILPNPGDFTFAIVFSVSFDLKCRHRKRTVEVERRQACRITRLD